MNELTDREKKAIIIMDQILEDRSDGIEQRAWDILKKLLYSELEKGCSNEKEIPTK